MATRAGVAATVQVLLWLQVARAAGTPTPACPTRPDKMVVVMAVDASNASTPYYSWAKCNEGLAGAQQRHPTERIAAYNETEHGVVTLLNIANCNLDCLDHDAFAFAGASTVTTVDVHGNNFAELPEALLSNLSSLRIFNGDRLAKLSSLPPRLFRGHGQLQELSFKSCSNLGNGGQGLPGGLLQGLTSLAKLAFSYSPIKSLPSLDDLKALTEFNCEASHAWHMNDTESEIKFDALVSTKTLYLQGNRLTQIPKFKKMRKLIYVNLGFNVITRIAPGDFAGATQLSILILSGNAIVSVAASAFRNLAALNMAQEKFFPQNALDASRYKNAIGLGLWPRAEKGFHGGEQEYAYPAIAYAPNPMACLWQGPDVSHLNCSSCVLGFVYEATSTGDAVCVKPGFRPHAGWKGSESNNQLRLHDTRGLAINPDGDANTTTLRAGHTYTIPAPQLVPKERKFVGYAQPYSRIHYELDFSLGTAVDIGCGTAVVGDGTNDAKVPKSFDAHPLSSTLFFYQFFEGQPNPDATPPDPGYFALACPRFHRFRVTEPGNITIDTCSSMMDVALSIYKRTDDLTKSERMMRNNGSWVYNQRFSVPLHKNNKQYDTVSVGLIRIQPDHFPDTYVDWLENFYNPKFPHMKHHQTVNAEEVVHKNMEGHPRTEATGKPQNNADIISINGCPLSQSAHRSYHLEVGDYFLQTSAIDPGQACSNFNIKMECHGAADTASPADGDPLGFAVNAQTGAITGTPQKVHTGYRMQLRAVDAEDQRAAVAAWTFDVEEAPAFALRSNETESKLKSKYHVNETHLLPRPRLQTTELLKDPADGDFAAVVYLLSADADSENPACTADSDATQVISALTDVQTGEGALTIKCEGNYTATLVVRDGAGAEVTVRKFSFEVLRRDTDVPEYGPGGRGCGMNGDAVDGAEMDRQFSCSCNAKFTGENCQVEVAATVDQDGTTATVIGAVLAVLVLAAGTVVLLQRWQRRTKAMMATDFLEQLQAMTARGELDEAQATKGGVPRELKRSWLALVDKLGHGAFGDVWKGLLSDGDNASPEYMVACKVVKAAVGSLDSAGAAAAEEELLKEALLMAQVETHLHLVSLVGVITRGSPKVLVLSFCEHGELQSALKKRAADGEAFLDAEKYTFCREVASGMAHLAQHNFVHRDLAARNVLLGSGMVCKVADFGLSRRVQTDDNTGDYYRSSSGIIPVRWTAPEGMASQKFSSASDVWSFAITCVEIFQDGAPPYPGVKSNPEVIKLVCTEGLVHPRPKGCSASVYTTLAKCWSFEPSQRPEFVTLEEFFGNVAGNLGSGGTGCTKAIQPGDPGFQANNDLGYDLGFQAEAGAPAAYDLGHDDVRGTHAGDCNAYDLNYQGAGVRAGAGAGQHYNLGHMDAGAPAQSMPFVDGGDAAADNYLAVLATASASTGDFEAAADAYLDVSPGAAVPTASDTNEFDGWGMQM